MRLVCPPIHAPFSCSFVFDPCFVFLFSCFPFFFACQSVISLPGFFVFFLISRWLFSPIESQLELIHVKAIQARRL
jgi:hypothetical protein